MQLAGRAVANHVVEALGGRVAQRHVLVLAGPGNNGGDGLIAARVLAQRGAAVTVVCPVPRGDDDPLLAECRAAGCSIIFDVPSDFGAALSKAEVVVDAVLGTGRSRAIEGAVRDALDKVAGARGRRDGPKVVAVDVPSGLDADTGEADAATVAADVTVALGSVKRGCLTPTGASYCGQIRVADIGLEPVSGGVGLEILDCQSVAEMLPNRPATGHKGDVWARGDCRRVGGVSRRAGLGRTGGVASRSGNGCYRGAGVVDGLHRADGYGGDTYSAERQAACPLERGVGCHVGRGVRITGREWDGNRAGHWAECWKCRVSEGVHRENFGRKHAPYLMRTPSRFCPRCRSGGRVWRGRLS